MSLEEYAKLAQMLQTTLEDLNKIVAGLRDDLAKRDREIAELRRMLFGKRGEKMPPIEREVAKRQDDAEVKKARRAAAAQRKKALPLVEVIHSVEPEQQVSTTCHGPFRDLGDGEVSHDIEYVPGRFIRRRHVRQKRVCRCGERIVVAPAPTRVADGVQYGPGLYAQVALAKCADRLLLYRHSKRLKREGVEVSDSTLGDLFHRTAQCCQSLYQLILAAIAASGRVNADETPSGIEASVGAAIAAPRLAGPAIDRGCLMAHILAPGIHTSVQRKAHPCSWCSVVSSRQHR